MQPDPAAPATGEPTVTPMLEMRGITKRFPGVVANDGVDLSVLPGQVHTLLGENGAGKSTLMKVLYGLYQPDEGTIFLNGDEVTITSPTDAIRQGIGMIHQHFMLVPTLTVAENVALGLGGRKGLADMNPVKERLAEVSERYGLQVDPDAYIWQLAVGERQRAEILKALYRDAQVLVLDEPTAVLTPSEVDDLFATLRQLTDDGRGLVFISHKLHEVHGAVRRDHRPAQRQGDRRDPSERSDPRAPGRDDGRPTGRTHPHRRAAAGRGSPAHGDRSRRDGRSRQHGGQGPQPPSAQRRDRGRCGGVGKRAA